MVSRHSARLVDSHYTVGTLEEKILEGLRAAGKDLEALSVEDLAPVDNFHMGGLQATRSLMELAGSAQGARVLDVGGGLGGPARLLAEQGAEVTVLDATREYCRVGKVLTDLVGLAGKVTFQHGDARSMPLDDRSFDLVWLQHTTMNIDDKPSLFSEMSRVLRPGGRLALHEVMAGAHPMTRFPVPWADERSMSFLASQDAFRSGLAGAGLTEVIWNDVTENSLAWWKQRLAAAAEQPAPPPLGIHLLMGASTPVKVDNMVGALEERMITVVQAVLARPAE